MSLNTLRNKTIIRRLSITILSFGLLLIATPFAIRYGITNSLNSLEGQQVKLDDVDFNPFTGTLIIKGLQSTDSKASKLNIPSLSIELDWLPLFKKQVLVKSLLLQNSQLSVEQSKDNEHFIAGFKLPAQEPATDKTKSPPSTWGVGIENITLLNNRISFNTPAFATQINIDDLNLKSLFSWQPTQAANFSFAIKIDGAAVSGQLDIHAFAESPHLKGSLNIDKLALDNIKPHTKNMLNQLKGKLSTDLQFALSLGKQQLSYQQHGSIKLHDLFLATDSIRLSQEQLAWDGELNFSQHQQVNELNSKGQLTLDKHQNTLLSPNLKTQIKSVLWNGQLRFNQQADQNNLFIKGDLSANKINSQSLSSKQILLQLNKLAIKEVSVEQLDNLQFGNITLSGLTLAQQVAKKPLIQAKTITFNTLKLNKLRDIDLENLNINNLSANININKQGNIGLLDEFISSLKPSVAETNTNHTNLAPSIQKEQKASIKIGGMRVSGNNRIKLSSATIRSSIKKNIHLKSLTIGEVNSLTPTKPTPFKLNASINEHSTLKLDGDITPFSQKTNAKITAKLTAFELPEFSPIIRQELGYDIESGQLNADIKGNVRKDMLDGKIKIAVNKLIMQPADPSKTAKITQQLAMPLDSALSLLRDENDDIELEIPIKGNIAKPDFDIGSVINTAIGNALQGTVTSYLKYALQPYGLIYMAAESAYGAATKLSLEPIKFKAGDIQRSKNAEEYIQSIGLLMQKRPQLKLRLCGFATKSDRLELIVLNKKATQTTEKLAELEAQLDDQLLLLAGKRQQWVKSYLITTYEINESRLFTCLPKASKEDSQPPRVELLI